ncbi:MAG: hypothetical protein KDK71_04120 [Chlamydiia bacterium]|nr:hypothetical protein [Chlamydiia bacterium]
MNSVKDKILTVAYVAKSIGVSTDYVLAAIKAGKLKSTYFRGEWHIRESNFLEYEKEHKKNRYGQKSVTLAQASGILKISQAIILQAVHQGKIAICNEKKERKVYLDSLMEWERKHFARDR